MSNPEAEKRIDQILSFMRMIDPSKKWHRESEINNTPIWRLCWTLSPKYWRIRHWCESQLEKSKEEFNDD